MSLKIVILMTLTTLSMTKILKSCDYSPDYQIMRPNVNFFVVNDKKIALRSLMLLKIVTLTTFLTALMTKMTEISLRIPESMNDKRLGCHCVMNDISRAGRLVFLLEVPEVNLSPSLIF